MNTILDRFDAQDELFRSYNKYLFICPTNRIYSSKTDRWCDTMAMVHVKGKDKGKVVLYALSTCVWCKKTKKLLTELGVDFSYVYVDLLEGEEKANVVDEVTRYNSMRSFPTLVIDDKTSIVGYQEKRIREVLG
jgi:glutaredoxin-like protein NrdH